MIYFCDYTKVAQRVMQRFRLGNSDIQEVFNKGFSESQGRKILDKNGYRTTVQFQYDGYTLRYVIVSAFRRKLKFAL